MGSSRSATTRSGAGHGPALLRRVLAACALSAAFASGAPAGPPEKSPEDRFETIRDVGDPGNAVRRIVAAARERGADSVAVVLDRATFDPPPGVNEFSAGEALVPFRGAWLDAAVAASTAPGAMPVAIATTTSSVLRAATPENARAVAAECDGTVWTSGGRELVRAEAWIDSFGAAMPGKRRAIVLVAGNVLPERWIHPPFDASNPRTREPWRSSLWDGGTYWREEEIAVAARRRGVTLFVVAPEARFGDEIPRTDIPVAPFASRPRVKPFTPATEPRKVRGRKPDDAARAAMTEELRRRGLDDASIAMALGAKDLDAAEARDVSEAGRFSSSMPTWFPRWGDAVPWTTDCPSGHGWWPYARAAAATGGAVVLHPFPPGRWMDACVRDDALTTLLAPPLVPRKESEEAATRDEALAAMLRAQAAVLDETPWRDYSHGFSTRTGGLWGWCGFELPGPAPVRRWEPRRMPIDLEHDTYWPKPAAAAVVAERATGPYTRAIRILAAAAQDPRVARAPRRSQANLRLCRFWFEMSLFHFQALAVASRDPVAFGAKDVKAADHYLATWNAIRLSDCVPSYDGRVLTDWDEKWYREKWTRAPAGEPYQGAFLGVPTGDPNFRALRDTDRVLANLDARLRPQALATISAAREVMAREARSPWGWSVYYSMLHTYAWSPPDSAPPAAEGGERPPTGSTQGGATTPK